jgi:large subunit ribosomal protein L35
MPKMKTKKIVAKRFKITKTGKIMFRAQGARHLRRNKSKSRQRRQDKMHQVKNIKSIQVINQLMQGR